jgi:hypothetical protein
LKETLRNLEGKCFKVCKKGCKCSQDREVLEDIKELANKILDRIERRNKSVDSSSSGNK